MQFHSPSERSTYGKRQTPTCGGTPKLPAVIYYSIVSIRISPNFLFLPLKKTHFGMFRQYKGCLPDIPMMETNIKVLQVHVSLSIFFILQRLLF